PPKHMPLSLPHQLIIRLNEIPCLMLCLAYRSFLLLRRPRFRTLLFPYTTLFRSFPAFELFAEIVEHCTGHDGSALSIAGAADFGDRKSTRLNSSHVSISYAVFCLQKR